MSDWADADALRLAIFFENDVPELDRTRIAAALRAARQEALEEAAKCADEFKSLIISVYGRGPNDPPGNTRIPLRGEHVAAAIRALAKEPK